MAVCSQDGLRGPYYVRAVTPRVAGTHAHRGHRKPWRQAPDRSYGHRMTKIHRRGAVSSTPPHSSVEAGAGASTHAADHDGTTVSERGRRWQRDNQAAIDCYNQWIADNGLPLEDFRRF